MNDLWRLSAAEVAQGVVAKTFTAKEVVEQTLARLDDVNPKINAVVQSMPEEALLAAQQVDARVSRGEDAGLLAGVPVTVKVNVDQAGYATTNGLVMLKDHIAAEDNPVVDNLRKAGAIIIGRTNTPAFSMRWFTRNSLHGHTLNPHNPDLTPGGSSGGAAAAVAAGIGAIGHGTDIAGSIRYPAYACGLHGLRPTLGRIPALNLSLPDRHLGAQITAVSGPIARTVQDVQLGYEAMSQASDLDPWWTPSPKGSGSFPKTVALCTHPDGLETVPEVVAALREAAKCFTDAGWKVVEVECPSLREPMELQIQFWLSESQLDGGQAIAAENDPDANFVYAQITSLFDQPTLPGFMGLLQRRVGLIRLWQKFLRDYPILLCPVSAQLPFPDQLDVQSPESFRAVVAAQMPQIGIPFLRVPAMTVAVGQFGDIPMGVQLVAGPYREDVLFQAAMVVEERSKGMGIAEPGNVR